MLHFHICLRVLYIFHLQYPVTNLVWLNLCLYIQEFPFVRYRAPKGRDASTTNFRELVPEKLATAIWNNITMYRSSIPNFPQKETCELLILDRSVDQVLK